MLMGRKELFENLPNVSFSNEAAKIALKFISALQKFSRCIAVLFKVCLESVTAASDSTVDEGRCKVLRQLARSTPEAESQLQQQVSFRRDYTRKTKRFTSSSYRTDGHAVIPAFLPVKSTLRSIWR